MTIERPEKTGHDKKLKMYLCLHEWHFGVVF